MLAIVAVSLVGCVTPTTETVSSGAVASGSEVESGDLAWRRAEKVNATGFYQHFLRNYPNHVMASEAMRRIDRIAWDQAVKTDMKFSYQGYLRQYPEGIHAREAKARIESLRQVDELAQKKHEEKQARETRRQEAEEKAARERLLARIPSKVHDEARVRSHFGKNDEIAAAGAAAEFVLREILSESKQSDNSAWIEPVDGHPLFVEFVMREGTYIESHGKVGETKVKAQIGLFMQYLARTLDPATEEIRKSSGLYVPLIDPRLHILSGGFQLNGSFSVGARVVSFRKGGVMTMSDAKGGFFLKGTEVAVGESVMTFDGKDWKD